MHNAADDHPEHLLVGSGQAIRLIFKSYHPKSGCFQALEQHFHAPKCPSKASLYIQYSPFSEVVLARQQAFKRSHPRARLTTCSLREYPPRDLGHNFVLKPIEPVISKGLARVPSILTTLERQQLLL
jgi:hypothetical protein